MQEEGHSDNDDQYCSLNYELPLNPEQLTTALQVKLIDQISNIGIRTIEDWNKFDMFVRCLTLIQIIWLVFGLELRILRKYVISQLESLTAALVVCPIVTYFLCWNKSKGVLTSRYADAACGTKMDRLRSIGTS